MKNTIYNPHDEVIVQLGKYLFYYAQVLKQDGDTVHIILKENTLRERTFLYDKEVVVNKQELEKIYDAETDTCLDVSHL